MIADTRSRPGVLAEGLLSWSGFVPDEADISIRVAAFRLAEFINAVHATLTKKGSTRG